jgi:hypothetical protein
MHSLGNRGDCNTGRALETNHVTGVSQESEGGEEAKEPFDVGDSLETSMRSPRGTNLVANEATTGISPIYFAGRASKLIKVESWVVIFGPGPQLVRAH